MAWLDDQFIVSGSRDGTLALWRVTDELIDEVTSSEIPSFVYTKPLVSKPCKQADRVRSLCYNHAKEEVAVISINGYIHCWNASTFKQVKILVLSYLRVSCWLPKFKRYQFTFLSSSNFPYD